MKSFCFSYQVQFANEYPLYCFVERSSFKDILGKGEYSFVDCIKCGVQLQLVLSLK